MDDNAKFRVRLQKCVDKFGSVYGLAKKAGLSQNTVGRYFIDSEPTRPKLIAIADAADVTIGWLVRGDTDPAKAVDVLTPAEAEYESSFQQRFNSWINIKGGFDSVADKSGIPVGRLQEICSGAEIKRRELAQLAKRAKAPLAYLLVGEPDETSKQIDEESKDLNKTEAATDLSDSDERFKVLFSVLVTRYGGAKQFSAERGLDLAKVESLLAGGRITIDRLAPLASDWDIPIRWLISDEPAYHGYEALESNAVIRKFINRLEKIDDQRLFTGQQLTIQGRGIEPSWRETQLQLLERIYKGLPLGPYNLFELKGSVGNFASAGDLAVVDTSAKRAEDGFYVFSERADQSGYLFVRRVSRTAGVLYDVSGAGTMDPVPIADSMYTCVGRVIVLIRRLNL